MLRSIIFLLKLQRACCHKRISHVFTMIQWLWVCSSRNLCPVVSSLSKKHIDIKDVITGFYFHNIIWSIHFQLFFLTTSACDKSGYLCLIVPCAGFSFASDFDETQPMDTTDIPDFDMAIPLTDEQADEAAALADPEPQVWWLSISCLLVFFRAKNHAHSFSNLYLISTGQSNGLEREYFLSWIVNKCTCHYGQTI